MLTNLPTLEEIKRDKKILKKEYEKYLRILRIKDINMRAKRIFSLYEPAWWPVGCKNMIKELFSAEREDVINPLNNGFTLIQFTEFLHYIMKARDILNIKYKCQKCLMRATCCDYDRWMIERMYDQCSGVEILSDRFTCFISRKYILSRY